MEYLIIDGQNFYNMVVNACNKLEEQKEFVNSLNVFPVPDGDTGTNMSMTFKSAVNEIQNSTITSISEISKKFAKGSLMGARGNSGVILSQILRGLAKGFEGKDTVNAEELANAFLEGSKSAYKAVMRPTEGTILTIVRTAGESAIKSKNNDIVELLEEICRNSESMLNKTPEMLPVLKKAKVVDAGGMGLLIILKGMYEALRDGLKPTILQEVVGTSKTEAHKFEIEEEIKFGYCTEFFVMKKNGSAEELRKDIMDMGDSMIVVGVDDIIKIHIHTNDPGLVLSNALKYGDLSKIKIDNMREQHRHLIDIDTHAQNTEVEVLVEKDTELKEFAFIAIAAGSGLKDIFKDLGVDEVIEGGQTMNPSTEDIVHAIGKLNAKNIFVFPNNKNIIMAANQAKELTNKNVIIIPTKTVPQGITCITTFNAENSIEENTQSMINAIDNVKTGSITYAVRATEIEDKKISEGDILGLLEGKIGCVGENPYEVCEELLSKMVDEDSELITVFYGKDCEDEKVNKLIKKLEKKYDQIDVQSFNGNQPIYFFLVSVE